MGIFDIVDHINPDRSSYYEECKECGTLLLSGGYCPACCKEYGTRDAVIATLDYWISLVVRDMNYRYDLSQEEKQCNNAILNTLSSIKDSIKFMFDRR